jgi:hypothetical protein
MTMGERLALAKLVATVAADLDARGYPAAGVVREAARELLAASDDTKAQRPVERPEARSGVIPHRTDDGKVSSRSGGMVACRGARCSVTFTPRAPEEGGPPQVWCSQSCRLAHRQRGRRQG